jgi:DNA-binding GntR family transcriptional regulator
MEKRDVGGEHRAILEATLKRNAEKAVKLLAKHLSATTTILLKADIEGTARA